MTPDDIARLDACRAVVVAKGAESVYAHDCVVRAYQARHVSELCRDLGWACDDMTVIVIAAGIGTLTLRWSGNALEPAPTPAATTVNAAPRPADQQLREQRLAACAACSSWSDHRCRLAGCGCSGLGQPALRCSRCPIGRW